MYRERRTAIFKVRLARTEDSESRPLDVQREYQFFLNIDRKSCPGGSFYSPLGDDRWGDVTRAMRELSEGNTNRHLFNLVYDTGLRLYRALCQSNHLASFLKSESGPRRLVIESDRPEIHLLPWEAMLNDDGLSLAYDDISIVHSLDAFEPQPYISGPTVHLLGLFGPATERLSFQALEELKQNAASHLGSGLDIQFIQEETVPDTRFNSLQADIIHIEAHGVRATGEIQLPDWLNANEPIALAEKLRNHNVVLLWSCYSALVHSWGESLAMRINRRGAKFVLAFSTPLRYTSSAAIANAFYTSVFSARDAVDAESTIVDQRKHLHQVDLGSCDWAAMTLWLQQPLDFSAAVFNGPRLPEGGWGGNAAVSFEDKDVPGRAVLFPQHEFAGALSYSVANDYRGAAIHLSGRVGLEDSTVFEKLEITPSQIKSHPGDRFIQLLEALATYPKSLLVWSNVTRREIQLVDLLAAEIPQNLAIVLLSPDDVSASPNIIVVEREGESVHTEEVLAKPDPIDLLERLNNLVDSDQFPDATVLWRELNPDYSTWDSKVQLRYQINGYWSFIRVGLKSQAQACVQEVEQFDEFEGLLLRGNLLHRDGLYDPARIAYTKAMQKAVTDGNERDEGRALIELAYLYADLGDRQLSEEYYGRSIKLLERVDEDSRDWRWRSPMGRVLRDFAELLIKDPARVKSDPARAQECAQYLKRAMAIHAIDDRLNQVGAVLRSQGALATIREEWVKAEEAFRSAASIFHKIGNPVGWATTIREIAELSHTRKQYDQCLAILLSCLAHLNDKYPGDYVVEKGLAALQLARAYWNQGKLIEAREWFKEAQNLLPEGKRRERAEVESQLTLMKSLLGN
jgi:tetratricopeptide (TPR) repeat protein